MKKSIVNDNSLNDIIFAPEERLPKRKSQHDDFWHILIVDDEQSVHDVTKIALNDFEFEGKTIQFDHAYTAQETKEILASKNNFAVAIIDVVMETEQAGLDLIKHIRETLQNKLIRIILRTGQPGQAPERKILREFDINDYKEKTELTANKLFSTIFTSIRSYRDLVALDGNRRGLEQVIKVSGDLFSPSRLNNFIQGILEQLIALLYLDEDALYLECDCLAIENIDQKLNIVAATGRYKELVNEHELKNIQEDIYEQILEAFEKQKSITDGEHFVGYFQPRDNIQDVIYVKGNHTLSSDDIKLIELFLRNASIAYENTILSDEIEGTQRDMLYMLGESIETRSQETGNHVRRVAEYCKIIACGLELNERDCEILYIASPLHDFGKIAIPESILHKPGKLLTEEWQIMKTHAQVGAELLGSSEREILKAASIIAGQHHEHWDGSGYPKGLSGEEIHIFGRIVAIADVFDALGTERSYKKAWPLEEIISYIQSLKGKQFDPSLVDWVMDNVDIMTAVRDRYPDTHG